MSRPYRPSNGIKGACFISHFCCECERDRDENCDILARTFAFNIDDKEYPVEWIRGENGPTCTAFIPKSDPIPKPRCDKTIDMFEGN